MDGTMTRYDKIRLAALETIYWFSDQFHWTFVEEMLIEIDLEKLLRRIK
jgi:hypothetical protein